MVASTHDGPERTRRIDAQRNQARIFAAAKSCFADKGAAARMEDIARLAQMGVGSLYRSFGSRAGLAEAIFRDSLNELVVLANQLSAQKDPAASLKIWLRTYTTELYGKRLMLGDLLPLFDAQPQLVIDARAHAVAALAKVLTKAQAEGAVRGDVDAHALMQLVNGLAAPADGDPDRAHLLLDVVLDGLSLGHR